MNRREQADHARRRRTKRAAGHQVVVAVGLLAASAAGATSVRAGDVLATVEGRPITRREVVLYWLQIDSKVIDRLGPLVADRWRNAGAGDGRVPLSGADLYARLSGDRAGLANVLSGMVRSRIVAAEAARRGIVVTDAEARARGHEMLEQVRQQQGRTEGDAQLLAHNHVPVTLFLEDMRYRVRTEKLLAADIAARNGHPIGAEDWIIVRALHAIAPPGSDTRVTPQALDDARARVTAWRQEVLNGASMEDVARDHNEDPTQNTGGLNGAWLRGTGDPALERVVFMLNPGELSAPVRAGNGWYVFRKERSGAQVTKLERDEGWRQVVLNRLPAHLASVRRHAHVTSTLPLTD